MPRDIEVEFKDGRFTCVGDVTTLGREEFVSADLEGVMEKASGVEITCHAEGRVHFADEVMDIEPGDYLVNHWGLFKRVAPDPS
jgi:hypothetical protein